MKGSKKSSLSCPKAPSLFSKRDMDRLYNDDKFDKMSDMGIVSPHEANLMRKGKYKKLR